MRTVFAQLFIRVRKIPRRFARLATPPRAAHPADAAGAAAVASRTVLLSRARRSFVYVSENRSETRRGDRPKTAAEPIKPIGTVG